MELHFQYHSKFTQPKIWNLKLIQHLSLAWLMIRHSNLHGVASVKLLVSCMLIFISCSQTTPFGFLKKDFSTMWPDWFHHFAEIAIFSFHSFQKGPFVVPIWCQRSLCHYYTLSVLCSLEVLQALLVLELMTPFKCSVQLQVTLHDLTESDYDFMLLHFLSFYKWTKYIKAYILKKWLGTNFVCWKIWHFLFSDLPT